MPPVLSAVLATHLLITLDSWTVACDAPNQGALQSCSAALPIILSNPPILPTMSHEPPKVKAPAPPTDTLLKLQQCGS